MGLNLPVAHDSMEFNDKVFLFLRECTSFEVRPQVIYPPQSATLATPLKPCNHQLGRYQKSGRKKWSWRGKEKQWKWVIEKNKVHMNFDCTCKLRDSAPTAMPMLGYVVHELLIFLRRPEPLPQLLLVTAGVPSH